MQSLTKKNSYDSKERAPPPKPFFAYEKPKEERQVSYRYEEEKREYPRNTYIPSHP